MKHWAVFLFPYPSREDPGPAVVISNFLISQAEI